MSIEDARAEAEKFGLDLIEVAPEAQPPVCRIFDYGKFRYEQQKKQKEAQKKARQMDVKGIRVRPNTDEHDLAVKTRQAIKFLRHGDKVKFTVIFRGPELRHTEIGQKQLEHFMAQLSDYAIVDQPPRMEGRRMTMVLEPKKNMPPASLDGGERGEKSRAKDEDKESRSEAPASDGQRADLASQLQTESLAVQEEPSSETTP